MNLFELFVKIGVDDQASGKLSNLSSKLGNGLKTAAKIGTAAVATAAAGITALTKAAVDNYAEYEQLVGGIETLFEDLSWDVGQNAAKAFQTAGLSANEYMSTAMSFAASLNQSLIEMDGNIARSADLTDQAILDMADNANKMGSDMSTLQTAYAGFAKQNYTLLDNLKIGYGGTKEEMQRLIADAAELSDTVDAQSMSFANIVEAIHVVQTEMGITGTTAKEAGATIAGSVGAMKSAWANLVTGLADGNADIALLVDNLVTTIVGDGTENNLGVLGNILPAVETALNGAATLIQKLVPQVMKLVPKLVTKNLPVLIKSAVSAVKSLVESIKKNKNELIDMVFELVGYISESFLEMLPEIVELGLEILVSLANGIVENLDTILPAVESTILKIVDALTDEENLQSLLNAAMTIIKSLVMYLIQPDVLNRLVDASVEIIITISTFMIENVHILFDACVEIINALVEYLTDPENLKHLASAAVRIIQSLSEGLSMNGGKLESAAGEMADSVVKNFSGIDLSDTGKKVAGSFIGGFWAQFTSSLAGGNPVTSWLLNQIIGDAVGDLFSRKSAGGGAFSFDGSHMNGLSYVPYDGYIAELHKGERVLTASEARGYGGVSIGNITINIDGANYEDEQALAEAIAAEIQNMTDRRLSVYA